MGRENLSAQISKKEEVLSRVLFLANSVALGVILAIAAPKAHQLAKEYSAGVALICTLTRDVECARGADYVAEKLGANRRDEIMGAIKIVQGMLNSNNKKSPRR